MSKKKKKSISIKTIIFLCQTSSLTKRGTAGVKRQVTISGRQETKLNTAELTTKMFSLTTTGIKSKTKITCSPISHQIFSSPRLFTSYFLMFNLEHLQTSFPALAVLFALKRYK